MYISFNSFTGKGLALFSRDRN